MGAPLREHFRPALARLARRAARCAAGGLACALAVLPALGQTAGFPQRVVTLAPHITEMVFAAGAGHSLAGTVVSSNYPDAARALPKVGDGAASINAEALIGLKPDLVLAWHNSGAAAAVAPLLQELGIPLAFLAPTRLDDIPDQVESLGARLGVPQQARDAASAMRDELSALRGRHAGRPPVSVLIEIGSAPLFAVGKDTLLNDALHTCGGVNIFEDSSLAALPVGTERIVQESPEVILAAAATVHQERQAQRRWAAVGLAPQTGTHVYGIDPDTFFRPGPRLIHATRDVCRKLEDARRPR